ncbi:MAG TPA: hypothetical protein VFP87_06350 [Chitinophagaceae bacterium]|nr:hypothetical protein [Chitinophagaceae bacterium]
MWNNSDSDSWLNWKVTPALDTENLFETFAGPAADGKTNENGTPKFLQVVLIANKYGKVFRLSRPPYKVHKIVFFILTPFAYIAGYKPTYKKYFR